MRTKPSRVGERRHSVRSRVVEVKPVARCRTDQYNRRMKVLPDVLKDGYVRLMDPVADWFVRRGVSPNALTVAGTVCQIFGGGIYATGHIRTAGFFLGVTAFFDLIDGIVARRSNRSTAFGAFLDSSLDRVADGAVLGGLAVFYAVDVVHHNVGMLVVCLAGIIGSFMTSYMRARAESLG